MQNTTDENGSACIKRGDSAIDIQIALLPRGEGEFAGLDGFGTEDLGEFSTFGWEGHPLVLAEGGADARKGFL
jgi:hypothetical protein